MDETGLFYRDLPIKILSLKSENCNDGKFSKERLSIAICCNLLGTDKCKLLAIGKSNRPRCFGKMNIDMLPVCWRSNKKAWITSLIFKEWILEFDNKCRCKNRKILLFLDNITSFHDFEKLNTYSCRILSCKFGFQAAAL